MKKLDPSVDLQNSRVCFAAIPRLCTGATLGGVPPPPSCCYVGRQVHPPAWICLVSASLFVSCTPPSLDLPGAAGFWGGTLPCLERTWCCKGGGTPSAGCCCNDCRFGLCHRFSIPLGIQALWHGDSLEALLGPSVRIMLLFYRAFCIGP